MIFNAQKKTLVRILIMILFLSCKTEYRKIIDIYPNGKVNEENVYPYKDDKAKYTIITYYSNG